MINDFVALDFEFGEVKKDRISIVEVGMQKVQDQKLTDKLSMLINPESNIDSYASDNIHHIYQSDVVAAPKFGDAWAIITNFIDDNHVVVHDAKNEGRAILSNATFYNLKVDNLVIYDTLKLAKCILPQHQKYNIAALSKYFDLPKLIAHDALDDAQETAQLFIKMQNLIFEKQLQYHQIMHNVKINVNF
ncbi:3'-5' exonuclease [Periweissella beninensis]|uniref:Exonuclease domain-containing protein n=1 Tax=Periweissella beninensis TaxID=504936 RepID=A0ABT0VID4_9LACO|nr:exonuclease domain-containing protein [Periweissella beninensis]MBM7544026.1 DNA polymerase III epsilon subunit-like protein [Periweissella beninensis]MCM2437416.1 hypothetical protein [Periweissella beninensis]MCT4396535.1 hypothetical protein [Periweissella beninensis]